MADPERRKSRARNTKEINMTDAWLNAFGAGLNIGVDVPTAVVGAGLGNSVGGSVTSAGEQHVGDSGHYGGFGDINIAVSTPTVVAGNGAGNVIGGDAAAQGGQDVGAHDLHTATPFGEINVAVSTPIALAGNGLGNVIGGNVIADGGQHVGDHGFASVFGGQPLPGGGAVSPLDAPHGEFLAMADHGAAGHHVG
jgi:hypothetical protein